MGNRFVRGILALGALVLLATVLEWIETPELSAPRRPLIVDGDRPWAKYAPAAPPEGNAPGEPVVELVVDPPHWTKDISGSAFAVAPGTWVTAAHVLQSCKAAHISVEGKWLPVVDKAVHPSADVAVARTAPGERPPLIGITDRPPVLGQSGFHFGYPQQRPAEVHTVFVGEARLRLGGLGAPLERGWLWAEQSRTGGEGSLGGISGGPQVDRTGAVQGVNIVEWPRTGRLVTAPVARLREMLPEDIPAVDTGGTSIDGINYPQQGTQVRGSNAVAFVLCSLSGRLRLR